MEIILTDHFEEQRGITETERDRAMGLLSVRFSPISREDAQRRITTMPHITAVPLGNGDTAYALSLDNREENKNVVFAFHGDEIVVLGFIRNDKKTFSREQLINKNASALSDMGDALTEYVEEHQLQETSAAPGRTAETQPPGKTLAERFRQRAQEYRGR